MAGNTFGRLFTLTTFGESHGPCMGAIVDGCPSRFPLSEEDIQAELDRRRPGRHRYTSQRRESDRIKILSGVMDGLTLGTPIGLLIDNEDAKSSDYDNLKDVFRPGHADFTYYQKYGIRDHRGGGRASARGTALWVAAGAIAKKYLAQVVQIQIRGCVKQIGEIHFDLKDWAFVNQNPFFSPDPEKIEETEKYLQLLIKSGNSIGALIRVEAMGIPAGLGEPVFHKLSADIAHAMMSINAAKAVALGDGFSSVTQLGTEHRDEILKSGFASNHAGGCLGGISTGQPIIVEVAFKPTSSLRIPARSLDTQGNSVEVMTHGRHDPCVGLRAVPIAEAMLALVLMDHWLQFLSFNKSKA